VVLDETLTPLHLRGVLLAFLGLVGGQLSETARARRAALEEQAAPAPVSSAS